MTAKSGDSTSESKAEGQRGVTQDQVGSGKDKNPNNFANNPERAAAAGRKGGHKDPGREVPPRHFSSPSLHTAAPVTCGRLRSCAKPSSVRPGKDMAGPRSCVHRCIRVMRGLGVIGGISPLMDSETMSNQTEGTVADAGR
jgi:general stress protein YciG